MTAIVAIIASLLGAVIGGRFAVHAVKRSHSLQQQTKSDESAAFAERVRAMLGVEIEDIVRALERFDAGIDRLLIFSSTPVRKGLRREEVLDVTQLPLWKHEYWRALTVSVPLAMSPDEIRKCHEHHFLLDELAIIKVTSRDSISTWHHVMDRP